MLNQQRFRLCHRAPGTAFVGKPLIGALPALLRQRDRGVLDRRAGPVGQRIEYEPVQRQIRHEVAAARAALGAAVGLDRLIQARHHLGARAVGIGLDQSARQQPPRLQAGLALPGAAAQCAAHRVDVRLGDLIRLSLHGRADQRIEAVEPLQRELDQRLGRTHRDFLVPAGADLGFCALLAEARLDVREPFDVADRHHALLVLGADRGEKGLARRLELLQLEPGHAERRVQLRQALPGRRAALFDERGDAVGADADFALAHRAAPVRQVGARAGQVVEQLVGRGVEVARRRPRCTLRTRFGDPARVAIGLERAPGDVAAVGLPGRGARREYGIAERVAAQQ